MAQYISDRVVEAILVLKINHLRKSCEGELCEGLDASNVRTATCGPCGYNKSTYICCLSTNYATFTGTGTNIQRNKRKPKVETVEMLKAKTMLK